MPMVCTHLDSFPHHAFPVPVWNNHLGLPYAHLYPLQMDFLLPNAFTQCYHYHSGLRCSITNGHLTLALVEFPAWSTPLYVTILLFDSRTQSFEHMANAFLLLWKVFINNLCQSDRNICQPRWPVLLMSDHHFKLQRCPAFSPQKY